MKSAYELAMERLNKSSPAAKLTGEQKKELAELDSVYSSKIAQREIFLKGEMAKAIEKGAYEEVEQFEQQLLRDRKTLQVEMEDKKEKIRKGDQPVISS